MLKLFGKAPCASSPWLIFSSCICLLASAVALLIFFLRGDLLLLFFVMTVVAVFRVTGALSVPSPFANVGAQRELLQMLAYEPLLILTFVGFSVATGGFLISDIDALRVPLLPHLPFLYLAPGYALTIKLAKSPFDIAASHHGHQEIVRGVLTEYSGPQLALLEISHWLDVVLLLGLCSLFWNTGAIGMIVLLALTYLVEILVDNVCARMTWQWMLKQAFGLTLVLAIANILWRAAAGGAVFPRRLPGQGHPHLSCPGKARCRFSRAPPQSCHNHRHAPPALIHFRHINVCGGSTHDE